MRVLTPLRAGCGCTSKSCGNYATTSKENWGSETTARRSTKTSVAAKATASCGDRAGELLLHFDQFCRFIHEHHEQTWNQAQRSR